MQDRHLKEWSLKPSLKQPAISLEASPGGPRRPCPSAGGPPHPPVPRDPEQGAPGAEPARRKTPRRRQNPLGTMGPLLPQEQVRAHTARYPRSTRPALFLFRNYHFQ